MVEYDNLQIYWIDLGWVYHQIYPQIYHHDMGNKIIPKYDIYICICDDDDITVVYNWL